MANHEARIAVAAAFALIGCAAHAQSINIPIRPTYSFPSSSTPASGPANIRLADTPLFITPYLGVGAGYDDNLFLTSSREKSSTYYVMSPGFRLDARDANKVFALSYQGTIGRYGQSEADDYVDHTARAAFDMAF